MPDPWRDLPFTVTWYLTTACNLSCEYCYNRSKAPPTDFDLAKAKSALKGIAAARPFSLSLIGGEIFLLKGLMDLIKEANHYGIKVNLATNGLVITRAHVEGLQQMDIGFIQISLDGSTAAINDGMRGEGTYRKILATVETLRERGFKVDLATTISRPNLGDLVNVLELGNTLGVGRIKYNLYVPTGPGAHARDKYEVGATELRDAFPAVDEYRKAHNLNIAVEKPCFGNFSDFIGKGTPTERSDKSYGCGAGTRTAKILNNGDVVGCEMFSDEMAGNVYSEVFDEIWRRGEAFHHWRYPKPLVGKCGNCPVFNVCNGGCRANAVLYTGDFLASDPLCWFGETS